MGCPRLTYPLKTIYRVREKEATHEEKVSRQNLKTTVDTGNYYYGARYYDPKISVWLSVDPLANQFPSWTPYHFVHNNPINLIDPTGMSATGPEGGEDDTDIGGYSTVERNTLEEVTVTPKESNTMNRNPQDNTRFTTIGSANLSFANSNDLSGRQRPGVSTGKSDEGYMAGAFAISGVLLADDPSGVGVIDDLAIPFIIGGAFILEQTSNSGNSNYPGPWVETQPDPTGFPAGGQYRGNNWGSSSGGNNNNPNGNPSNVVKWAVGMTAASKLMYDTFKRSDGGNLNPQDNTRIAPHYLSPHYFKKGN